MMEELLQRFGYAGVLLGTALEGEGVLLAAAVLARHGLLRPTLVVLAAFLGTVGAGEAWFFVGRRSGARLLARRPAWAARAEVVRLAVARRGAWFVLAFHFLVGLRTVTPLVLGASGYSARRFFVLNAAGTAVWAVVIGVAGWFVGEAVAVALRRAARVEELVAAAVLTILVAWLVRRLLRARR